MNYNLLLIIPWILFCSLSHRLDAQSVMVLDSCGLSYIDPQDAIGNDSPSQDTLIYETYFENDNRLWAYFVDVNAFGGQQIDRARVSAIRPDGSLDLLGTISFGNCIDCVNGFALVHDDSLLVAEVDEFNIMGLWLQSLNQPPFSLPGNLQTLKGVGRLSGRIPFCAEGLRVTFIVNNNPANTSTEFSAHIICPEVIADCSLGKDVRIDCVKDSIYLEAIIPQACFSDQVSVRWHNSNGWQINAPNAALPLAGNLGWYYLSVQEAGCMIIDSVFVENPSFVEAGPDLPACQGETVVLQGNGGLNHFWAFSNGEIAGDSILFIENIQATHEGFYVLHGFSEEGCEDRDTLRLSVGVPPIPEIFLSAACLGDTFSLSILNDNLFPQITWLDPQGNPMPSPIIPDLQPADFGEYALVVVDSSGCEVREVFELTAGALPGFEFLIEESCDSSRVYLSPEEYEYSWQTGEQGSLFSTATGGVYQLTITDAAGCSTIDHIDIPNPDGPDVELRVTQPLCPGDPGEIEIIATDTGLPLIFSANGGESYSTTPKFDQLDPGSYLVLVQDGLGCVIEFPVEIIRPDTIGVSLGIDQLEVRPNTPISLTAETIGHVQEYQWVPEDIDSGGPVTQFMATNSKDIRLIVRDDRGCHASTGFQLSIVLGLVYVPNSFSPNNNNVNDGFTFYSDNGSGEIIEFLRIYDRQGNMVFEAKEIGLNEEALGWDGNFNGKPTNPGVFAYHAVVRFGNDSKKTFKGDLTLMR